MQAGVVARRAKPNMTPQQEDRVIQLLTFGHFQSQAARHVGLSPQALTMRCKRYPEFCARVHQAEAHFEFSMIAAIVKAVPKDWRAALALLKGRCGKRWGDAEPNVTVTANLGKAAKQQQVDDAAIWKAAVGTVPSLAVSMDALDAPPPVAPPTPPQLPADPAKEPPRP